MQLIKLVTTNFKKLGNTVIEFTLGLNVLAGDNAQGKSTALQAIKCALFGVSMVPGKKENIPTWGQTKWEVQLTFWIAGATYQVTRTGSTAKLLCTSDNNRLVANGTTPVNLEVENLLGLASKDYGLFIESAQGESTGILTFGATALNRKVEEFAGVDVIDKVQALASTKAQTHLAKAEAKRPQPEEVELANQALDSAREQLKTCEADLKEAQAALDALGEGPQREGLALKDPNAMRDEQRAEERLWSKVEQAESDLNSLQARHTEQTERCASLSLIDVSELEKTLTAAKEDGLRQAEKVEAIEAAAKLRSDAEREADTAEKSMVSAQADFDAANKAADGIDADRHNKLHDAEEKLHTERDTLAGLKAKAENIKALADGAQCPTCGHVKDDHDPTKLAQELEAAQAAVTTQQAVVTDLLASIKDLKARVGEDDRLIEAMDRAAKRSGEAKAASDNAAKRYQTLVDTNPYTPSDLENAKREVEAQREAFADLRAKLKSATASNEVYHLETAKLDKLVTPLAEAQALKASLDAEYEALPQPPTNEEVSAVNQAHLDYQTVRQVYDRDKGERSLKVVQVSSLVTNAAQRVTEAEQRLARFVGYAKEADEAEALAKKYSRLVQFLRERRQKYLEEVWGVVLGVSSKLVNEASKSLITQIQNKEGEFFFVEGGIEAPTVSASGAQKSFIGTSLRVGLARALYGSDGLLIFDEPTESCTEENAAGMAAMLASSAKQVLLITHRENDQALAQNIINIGE